MKLKTQETSSTITISRALVLSIILLTSATAPFWHIFFEKEMLGEVFGFKNMRSFLYVFGSHFILFGFSIFIFWIIQMINNLDNKIRLIANLGTGLYCSVSIYYLLYVFIDTSKPYPDYYYEIAFISVAIIVSLMFYKIFSFLELLKKERLKKEKENEEFVKTSLSFISELNKNIVN